MKRRLIELISVILLTFPIFYLSISSVAKASGEAEKVYLKHDVNIFSKQSFKGKLSNAKTSLTRV